MSDFCRACVFRMEMEMVAPSTQQSESLWITQISFGLTPVSHLMWFYSFQAIIGQGGANWEKVGKTNFPFDISEDID